MLLAAALVFSAPAHSVSFDCSKAQASDQKAICGSDLASQLDDIAYKGYRFLKTRLGKQKINQLNRQILEYRQKCGNDVDCIIAVQVQTIRLFKKLGAPVSLPSQTAPAAQPEPQVSTAANEGPSFDCSRARLPDERAICDSSELSKLDRLTTQGFQQLRSTRGKNVANRAGKKFLAERHQCGDDPVCIGRTQLSAISAFKALAGNNETADAGQQTAATSKESTAEPDAPGGAASVPYQMLNIRWTLNNGEPFTVGTVASADDICRALSHPLFSQPASALALFDLVDGKSPSIDPDDLASEWLKERAARYGLDIHERGWLPTDSTTVIINNNLSACLRTLQKDNPVAYNNIRNMFITRLSEEPDCFRKGTVQIKKLNADGELVETEEPDGGGDLKCADFEYGASNHNNHGALNDTSFLAMISLNEARKALKTILDAADSNLAARQKQADDKRQIEQAKADAEAKKSAEFAAAEQERQNAGPKCDSFEPATDSSPVRTEVEINRNYRGLGGLPTTAYLANVQATADSVVVGNIEANRGNCQPILWENHILPRSLKFGEKISAIYLCNIIEIRVCTDKGGFTFAFQ